jgi:hypothetical protein
MGGGQSPLLGSQHIAGAGTPGDTQKGRMDSS